MKPSRFDGLLAASPVRIFLPKDEYLLHVLDDGTEFVWRESWMNACLRVRVISKKAEETYTSSIRLRDGYDTLITPRPKGRGWELHDGNEEKHFTVWRRIRQ